jgi:hypothetical protein
MSNERSWRIEIYNVPDILALYADRGATKNMVRKSVALLNRQFLYRSTNASFNPMQYDGRDLLDVIKSVSEHCRFSNAESEFLTFLSSDTRNCAIVYVVPTQEEDVALHVTNDPTKQENEIEEAKKDPVVAAHSPIVFGFFRNEDVFNASFFRMDGTIDVDAVFRKLNASKTVIIVPDLTLAEKRFKLPFRGLCGSSTSHLLVQAPAIFNTFTSLGLAPALPTHKPRSESEAELFQWRSYYFHFAHLIQVCKDLSNHVVFAMPDAPQK